MIILKYTEEIGGKNMDEKQLTEYKEPKGILQWLKSKFEKLKEKFRLTKNVEVKSANEFGEELSEDELDKVRGGIPLKAVDLEELMADLGNVEPKSWELTEEQLEEVNKEQDNDELSEEELDEVKGGQPIIDEER